MTEVLRTQELPALQPDRIVAHNGKLVGEASFLEQTPRGLKPLQIGFVVPATRPPLDAFVYNKPPAGPFGVRPADSEFQLGEPRADNIPLAVVRDVRRGPNHLYETDSGVLTAVRAKGPKGYEWQTRYYPKNCIPPETWEQAVELVKDIGK